MANLGAHANNSLVAYIVGDDSALQKTLKRASANVTAFQREVEVANKKATASTAAVTGAGVSGAGFFGRGGKGNQALRGVASGTGLGSAALFGSGAFIGAAISAGALKASISAASDLNEQITKSQQVFGDSSKAVIEWSKDTAKSMGIARASALQASGTFGNLFKAQGIGDLRNSKLSEGLVQLAADLASFNNVDVNQVLQDLQSGIVGEIEPVRKYGADLRIARVQLEALTETGKKNVKQLNQQDLTLARIRLLYQDTAAAQGDFQRTQGGLANQQRILSAQTKDLAAKTGNLLLPAAKELISSLNVLADGAGHVANVLNKIANIKIPPVHIPLIVDTPGGTVGHTAGRLFTLSGFVKLTKDTFTNLINDFKKQTDQATPRVAQQTAVVFSDFLDNVLIQASKQIKPKVSFGDLIQNVLSTQVALPTNFPKPIGPQTKNQNALIIAQANGDLAEVLRLQTIERDRLQKALANSHGNVKQRAALSRAFAQAQAAVITTQKTIAQNNKSQADAAKEAAKQSRSDFFGKIISSLELKVSREELTKNLNDDLGALEDLKAGYEKQIKAGVDVESAQQGLVSVTGQIAAKQAQIAQNARDAQKATLFKQIGLSATGGEIIPGVGNLKKQFEQLQKNLPDVQGTSLRKLTNRLAGVAKALASPFLKAQPEVRSAIADLFRAIRDEINKQTSGGPLTKTTSLNTNKVLKGLGLDATAAKELKSRLSNFNSAGIALAGGGVVQSAGHFPVAATGSQVNVNVELDGHKVAKSVTVHQQKRARSNPPQKRGPIGGRI